MKPYYDDGTCTIYHGDAREVLPTVGATDLLVTDPPYGIGADKNLRANKQHGKAVAPSRDYGVGDWDSHPPPPWLIAQAVDRCDYNIVWGGNHLGLGASPCWLVWDKDNGDNGYADCELKAAAQYAFVPWIPGEPFANLPEHQTTVSDAPLVAGGLNPETEKP